MEKQIDNNYSIKEKILLLFKKTLKYWFIIFISLSFLEFLFMFIIIFHHQISAELTIAEYIFFSFNIIFSTILIYPTFIYSNKSFWCNNSFLIAQIFLLIFIIPVTLFFNADITSTRINNTETNITISLTQSLLIYTSFGLWFSFIASGSSLLISVLGFYFASKISNRPWKLRIENEKVISKPTN